MGDTSSLPADVLCRLHRLPDVVQPEEEDCKLLQDDIVVARHGILRRLLNLLFWAWVEMDH